MACGTCHRPGLAGTDPRAQRDPGPDGRLLTRDDHFGSPGMRLKERSLLDEVLGREAHVTGRAAPSILNAAFAPELFWDGRAGGRFTDPESGEVRIGKGAALETQALEPILNAFEMAHDGRTWQDVTEKLAKARPLALARNLPPDTSRAIKAHDTYPKLFEAAFGDAKISATRIAFALASYERTLVPDQTPYDRFVKGDAKALTEDQQQGLRYMRQFRCTACHVPPMFTDHSYRNIGVRPASIDRGRGAVTGKPEDAGKFRVPSLRNVGLKKRFMHGGQFDAFQDVMRTYRFPRRGKNVDPLLRVSRNVDTRSTKTPMADFILNGLTDPRARAEKPPFDRPVLRSEGPETR